MIMPIICRRFDGESGAMRTMPRDPQPTEREKLYSNVFVERMYEIFIVSWKARISL